MENETEEIVFDDLTEYQKKIATNIGYMGIVACKSNPEEAIKNSIEILEREGVSSAVAVTAIYSFTNTLLVRIAREFKEPKDGIDTED